MFVAAVLFAISVRTTPGVTPTQVDTPPPMWRHEREPAPSPEFTPYTKAPRLLNRDFVREALVRSYPREAVASHASATVLLWVKLDTLGSVLDVLVRQSGGLAFDRAAVQVGRVMRFSPAKDRDRAVPVWIQVPVVFSPGRDRL